MPSEVRLSAKYRSSVIQRICPRPKRLIQQLIIDKGLESGLDVGCGASSILTGLRGRQFTSTGLDASMESLERAEALNLHDEYICGDITDASLRLHREYDAVVCCDLLEHLARDQGLEFIRRIEAIAKRLIYIETPYGFLEQTAFDGNVFQRHQSGWFPQDFQARGYTVFGSDIRLFRGVQGRALYLPAGLVLALERGFQWFMFRRPELAFKICAVKVVDEDGQVRSLRR